MTKLVIIGIDSMDRELIYKYLDYLPNFKKIIKQSPDIKSTSVFPPDSDTAWASIYTGLNPAKHGIVNFVDPLEKASIYQTDYLDISNIKGKTFWDIVGKFGKKVCLIYPHIAYPVWQVNGFMISPAPKTDEFQMYPRDFKFNFKVDKLEVPKGIPNSKSEYKEYLDKFREVVINEFGFGNNMLINYDWDLFFFYSSALDYIQHTFWNYCDPNDPTYPGDNNPFRDAIKDFYILHDKLVGEMIENIDSDTIILIFSDHGHSMRPIKLFNVNEILRKESYLFPKEGGIAPLYNLNEKLKRAVVNIAQKTDLRKLALNILRKYPKIKEMYTVPSSIDFNRTIAYCSDLSGMKSYTYGGIIISKDNLKSEEDYSVVRKNIIETLSNETLPNSNEKVFEWIREREELYVGEYINKYPDILFKLKEGYGAGWAIKVPVFSETPAHSFFPGSHRGDTPIFFMLNLDDKECVKENMTLMDVAPTVLDILGIEGDFWFDGGSILKE
jgi:predicted AlkP superfamily phosphohydrolase/phosphomutase